MPTAVTDADLQSAVDTLTRFGSKAKAAEALGLPANTFTGRLTLAGRRGIKPSKGAPTEDSALKARVKHLEAELVKATNVSATEESVRSGIFQLKNAVHTVQPPEWTISIGKDAGSPGVPTLMLSDFHWGEVVFPSQVNGVNKFNMAIARARLRKVIDSAVELLKIIDPKFRYPGIVVILGGDMVTGNIHPELTATNEENVMPTFIDLYGAMSWVYEELLKYFPAVFSACVTGNHGRDTIKIWNKDRHATSFDWLLYCMLAKRFEDNKRVTFFIPDGPDAYYKVFNHRYLVSHGDQFRGGDGLIGALGPIIRGDHKKRSRNAQIDMAYDTLCIGHWHQEIFLRRLVVNSSLKGYDEYAYNNNFPYELPSQQLWITHPRNGITFRMPVYADKATEQATKSPWVSVQGGRV